MKVSNSHLILFWNVSFTTCRIQCTLIRGAQWIVAAGVTLDDSGSDSFGYYITALAVSGSYWVFHLPHNSWWQRFWRLHHRAGCFRLFHVECPTYPAASTAAVWWWCIFLQQYRIHMDIGNSKNYLGVLSSWQSSSWPIQSVHGVDSASVCKSK